MTSKKDEISYTIETAFASNTLLKTQVLNALHQTPHYRPLFNDIAEFILHNRASHTNGANRTEESHLTKKRKLENGTAAPGPPGTSQIRTVILEARDISFQLPQRKKLHLGIVQYGNNFDDPSTTFSLCIRNPASNEIEYEYPLISFEHALCVSVPEKATKQYNYCFLPSNHSDNEAIQLVPGEGVIWTINHGPLKSCTVTSSDLQALISSEPAQLLSSALDAVLQRSNRSLTTPTDSEFACAIPESHRKNEKAYHVKAHRGSKDGYLWFLPTGIFFGFKKPLAFFPFHRIESVSYTAVLQRTFNLVIIASLNLNDAPQEIEFSMLDQGEFPGIDAYIKKHGLEDASMAQARKAKHFKVNGKSGPNDGQDEADGVGELGRAKQEAIDEEDEMEEDYDPEEDGDSDESGTSEEEEDYEAGDRAGRNLVEEELGSEAEEMEENDVGEAESGDEDDYREDEATVERVKPTKVPERGKKTMSQPQKPIPPMPSVDDEDQL